mgnify:CR=1 FL=1
MLELKNISFSVEENGVTKDILKDVSLTIDDKKFVATAGLRYDYNSFYNAHILTPRLHFRWKIHHP